MQDLSFISVQPLTKYYIWQCRIYGYNFVSHGVHPDNIHMVFASQDLNRVKEKENLEYLDKLINSGYQVHVYYDDRNNKNYVSSVRPWLLAKLIFHKPKIFGKPWFYHDADMVFRKLPNFKKLLDDDIIYISDTVSYIGAKYIRSKGEEFLDKMCQIVGINKQKVIYNEPNSGGAQYLMKGITGEVMFKTYFDCEKLFTQITDMINDKMKREPKHHALQIWTADMWAVLWNLLLDNKEVRISEELDFSWASDNIDTYYKKPILHMAGVTTRNCIGRFNKIEYVNIDPIECVHRDPKHFNYVSDDNATIAYVNIIKQLGIR